MPIQRCQRNGEIGWQYGNQKCHIPSEEGSDAEAKAAAIRQALAITGGNLDEEDMSEFQIKTYTIGENT